MFLNKLESPRGSLCSACFLKLVRTVPKGSGPCVKNGPSPFTQISTCMSAQHRMLGLGQEPLLFRQKLEVAIWKLQVFSCIGEGS